jgi:hypothetical protein
MNATIKGYYTSDKDTGKEYITGAGNLYVKILYALENGESLYDSVFLTPRAHWRVEDIFKAAGLEAPPADAINTSHFDSLIGEEVKINVGKNQQGYDTIKRFYPKALRDTVAAAVDAVPDEISEQTADSDLDEDVPF